MNHLEWGQDKVLKHKKSSEIKDIYFRLSCKSPTQWFFCMWNSPRSEQSCAIQLGLVLDVRSLSSLPIGQLSPILGSDWLELTP